MWSYIVGGMIQLAAGQADSALAMLTTSRRFNVAGYELGRPHRVAALHALGREAEARSLYDALRRDHAAGREADFALSVAAAGIGDRETALAALERAFAARSPLITEFSVPCDPIYDGIRDDPRFRAMIERAGMRRCTATTR